MSMTARQIFQRRRHLMRELNACLRLECETASRLTFMATVATIHGLEELRAVCATNPTLYHPQTGWTAGLIPRQVAGYEGDNFKRALRDRQLTRLCHRPAYQPGPARRALP